MAQTAPDPQADATAASLAAELEAALPPHAWQIQDLEPIQATQALMNAPTAVQVALVRQTVDRVGAMRERLGSPQSATSAYLNLRFQPGFPRAAVLLIDRLLRRKLPFTDDDLLFIVDRTAHLGLVTSWTLPYVPKLLSILESRWKPGSLPAAIGDALERLTAAMSAVANAPERKLRDRVTRLCGAPLRLPVEAGEAWSDRAIADLDALPPEGREAWVELLVHCRDRATGGSPTSKWLKAARQSVDRIGVDQFRRNVLVWFPLVDRPRTRERPQRQGLPDPNQQIIEPHLDLLKGLVWASTLVADDSVSRASAALALSAYRKLPLSGPRAVRLGNACVWALGSTPTLFAVGQLAVLRARVAFVAAQKGIEKSLDAAAAAMGMSRDDLEELGVPSYGFGPGGVRAEEIGGCRVEQRITGQKVTTTWANEKGKSVKSPPATAKAQHATELKELKAAAGDAEKMLSAQRDRLDRLCGIPRTWRLADWRQRYLEHPLVGTLARRLIWTIHGTPVVFTDDGPIGVSGDAVQVRDAAEVAMWHPAGRPAEEVVAWRSRLAEMRVTQPFKQAHREVYLLTDAELRTGTYSNRFAGHVIRQHQFNALCGARGWRHRLRLAVDDYFPPAHKDLPPFNLRAEFWVEGVGEYGTDTTESGAFIRLTTDQVRFYRSGPAGPANEPMAMADVPPLAFSETMRDVDLFVGVASVGNDPTWQDGGADGRFQNYWQTYSFGELSATAETRRAVLETLLPRLTRLRGRASLAERFLVVKGELRTYKIHLGSGNILMEPNDQYLCIVPDRSLTKNADGDGLFLPFEGDQTLAVILSKAFLLAEDKAIDDPTITRQIRMT